MYSCLAVVVNNAAEQICKLLLESQSGEYDCLYGQQRCLSVPYPVYGLEFAADGIGVNAVWSLTL